MTFAPDWVVSPGVSITRLLSIKEIAEDELAEELGMNSSEFEQLLSGDRRITREVAETLSCFLGSSPDFWQRRDEIFIAESHRLEKTDEDEVDKWIKMIPTSQVAQLGWIKAGLKAESLRREVLEFFGCESYSEWKAVYSSGLDAVAFRTSSAFEANDLSTLAWKRMGEIQAEKARVRDFDRGRLRELLPSLKRLSYVRSPAALVEKLRERLSGCGVILTTARAPKGCRASGATWISPDGNPVIHMSFRHLSDDHFWFTLYHEAAHVVLNHGEHVTYDRQAKSSFTPIYEREADSLASDTLVSPDVQSWIRSRIPNKDNVISAALKAKVTPGVIVGQLEHAGYVKHGRLSFLKRLYVWGESALFPVEK